MKTRRIGSTPALDEIDFIIIATEDFLKYWEVLQACEESEFHIKILKDTLINLKRLKERRNAGEDVAAEVGDEIRKNGIARMALNRIGPQTLMKTLKGKGMDFGKASEDFLTLEEIKK
jgi:hypothetical protein